MILVTGGLGFIGSKTAIKLSERGQEVRILDKRQLCDFETSLRTNCHLSNSIARSACFAAGLPSGEILQGDILNVASCDEACRGVDVVIHCITIHPIPGLRQPTLAIQTNVQGTLNMLRSAAAAGVSRFVFLSSAKVYGEPDGLPSTEGDLPQPTIPYGLSKLVSEYYCERFREETKMDTVVVRPFSVYGPGQDLDTGYVGMMIKAMMDAEEPTFPGRASYLRDFVHIDNVVDICIRIALEDCNQYKVFNAGSGSSLSLETLADVASRLVGRRLMPTYIRATSGTISRSQACLTRTNEIYDPSRIIRIEEGLKDTFEWFL